MNCRLRRGLSLPWNARRMWPVGRSVFGMPIVRITRNRFRLKRGCLAIWSICSRLTWKAHGSSSAALPRSRIVSISPSFDTGVSIADSASVALFCKNLARFRLDGRGGSRCEITRAIFPIKFSQLGNPASKHRGKGILGGAPKRI